jgi:hypothetical protein
MDNQIFSPVNTVFSQSKDNQIKSQPKKRISFPKAKRYCTLVYSTKLNKGGLKP